MAATDTEFAAFGGNTEFTFHNFRKGHIENVWPLFLVKYPKIIDIDYLL